MTVTIKQFGYSIATIALLLFINALHAQKDTVNHKQLTEVVITATRYPQPHLSLPYSSYIQHKTQMEQQRPRTMPEALTGIPGVFVQKTNHGGGSPFVRGLTGNQTLTLIDGIRLNNSTFRYGPNQYLNTIDAFTIHKIEVVKGSGAVQYGSDALGGVIQVFTKDPAFENKPNIHGNLTAKYMSQQMEQTIRGEASYGTQNFAVLAGYSYKNFGHLWGGDTTGIQSPSGYGENAFDIKIKYNLGRQWLLKVVHQSVMQKDVDVYHKVTLENYAINKMDPQNRHLNYLTLEKSFTRQYVKKLLLILSDQHTKEIRINQKNGSSTVARENDEVQTTGITTDLLTRMSVNWTANTGTEFYYDKVSSQKKQINTISGTEKSLRGLYPDGSSYANLSFYSLHHINMHRFVFEGGIRYNTFVISINDTSLGKVVTRPSAFVANAGLVYKINAQNSLYVNYSNGFRAPNIDDMGTLGIVDFRYELPAYNLKPERSNNFEGGYKWQCTKLNGNIAVFYNALKNIITRQKVEGQIRNGYPVYQKFNIEQAYIYGAEAEVGLCITPYLNVIAVTSYAYGQNVTRKEPMRRIPPMNTRVLINYQKEKWYARAEWLNANKQNRLAQGDKDDNRIPTGGTPGWNVLNIYGGYYMKRILINTGVQNIFNVDYRYHGSGINGPGRSIWMAVRLDF